MEFFSSTGLGTEVFEPGSSSAGLGAELTVCFSFFVPYAQKLAVVKKHNAAIIKIAETPFTNMDSLGNIPAAKVIQSHNESNQFIFFNKRRPFIFAGVSSYT